ncbi:FkbM family methyltransferase [Deltaproteobacteria bacterium]|nr:FkbM family methyltransferase [Deltaproteobacteria bacterium]
MKNIKELFEFDKGYYENKLHEKFPDISWIMDKKTPVVIYGAAKMGRIFKTNLIKNGINILAFADSNSDLWGMDIDGIKIISPEELRKKHPNNPILVASLLYETEIHEMLCKMQFPLVYPLSFLNYKYPDIFVSPGYFQKFSSLFIPENQHDIFKVNEFWEDEESKQVFYNTIKFCLTFDKAYIEAIKSKYKQYFEPGILSLCQEEVFIDCGAYTGDSVEQFCEEVSGKFKKVYSFEPDRSNFLKLCDTARRIDPLRIIPINSGVYHSTGKIRFHELGSIDTRIGSGESSVSLPVVSIHDFLKNKEDATFIKMDIEGAEVDALLGAKEIIQKNKPKLAISVYHKASHLWQIPLMIKRINKEYRLYLRHYTNEITDTVCYAL